MSPKTYNGNLEANLDFASFGYFLPVSQIFSPSQGPMGFGLYIEKGYKNIEVKVYVQKSPKLEICLEKDMVG